MNKIVKNNLNYTYDILKNDLLFLKYEYNYFNIESIGKSTLDRSIYFIKLGKGNKKIFINASHHANEWITSLVIMMFMERYLYNYKKNNIYKGRDIKELWDKISLYIVPMVNPDGVDLCLRNKAIINNKYVVKRYGEIWKNYINNLDDWKANIRGVDLNLNYPSGWEQAVKNKRKKGITSPCNRDYPGPNAVSEIETKNMMRFTELMNFDMTLSFHSQGREIYWNYLNKKIDRAYEIGKKMERVSGYVLTQPNYNSSFAGYKDWFIDRFNKPGYTIEIGEGEEGKPLPLEESKEIINEVEEIILVALENC